MLAFLFSFERESKNISKFQLNRLSIAPCTSWIQYYFKLRWDLESLISFHAMQVWVIFHIPSHLWSPSCLAPVLWNREARMWFWRLAHWDGSDTAASWLCHCQRQSLRYKPYTSVPASLEMECVVVGSRTDSWCSLLQRGGEGFDCPEKIVGGRSCNNVTQTDPYLGFLQSFWLLCAIRLWNRVKTEEGMTLCSSE